MSEPAFGDFGPEMNNLLNRLGCYVVDHGLSAEAAERLINTGIAATHVAQPAAAEQQKPV